MATMPGEVGPLFVDTNIWLYATDPDSHFHRQALAALNRTQAARTQLVTSPQILREYLAVGTRAGVIQSAPSLADLIANVADIRARCRLVDETDAVVDQLAALLHAIPTAFRRVHDANIVATMLTWQVPRLLTHNHRDFAPYTSLIVIEGLA